MGGGECLCGHVEEGGGDGHGGPFGEEGCDW